MALDILSDVSQLSLTLTWYHWPLTKLPLNGRGCERSSVSHLIPTNRVSWTNSPFPPPKKKKKKICTFFFFNIPFFFPPNSISSNSSLKLFKSCSGEIRNLRCKEVYWVLRWCSGWGSWFFYYLSLLLSFLLSGHIHKRLSIPHCLITS